MIVSPLDTYCHLGILNKRPLVLMTCLDSFDPFGEALPVLLRQNFDEPFTIFIQIWKSFEFLVREDSDGFAILLKRVNSFRDGQGSGRIVFLCNTPAEVDICRDNGCEAAFVSHNCLVNENIFFPNNEARKWDAVYNAQMWDIKRHELAQCVRSLSLIYSLHLGDHALDRLRTVTRIMPSANLVNGNPLKSKDDFRLLNATQVCDAYNMARVGLCLSAVEGAMFSSVEYLLTRLPVVTTRNQGGRDVFFKEPYCRWVEDDARQIAAAVDDLASAEFDPTMIRSETLRLLQPHRDRLRLLVIDHVARLGGSTSGQGIFPRVLAGPFGMPIKSVAELLKKLGRMSREDEAQSNALSREDIVFAYKLVHCREPESQSVIDHIIATCPNLASFRNMIFQSEEFRRGIDLF